MESTPAARILLAEDALSVRELLELYLTNAGYAVEMAEDGQAALDKFTRGKFDLVIMDIQMPVMDGYAAMRGIRSWERSHKAVPPVPIIAMTGNTEKEDILKCLNAGADAHLAKPIDKPALLALVSEKTRRPDAIPRVGLGDGDGFVVRPDPEIAHLLPGFINHRREDIAVIRRALEQKDYAAIADLCHKMAGVGTSFGLEPVSRFGRAMELAAKRRDSQGIAKPLEELSGYLQRVRVVAG